MQGAEIRAPAGAIIFPFGAGAPASPIPDRRRIGAKGHHLAIMCDLSLPVPPGFVIETEMCRRFLADGKLPVELKEELVRAITRLGERAGRSFWCEDAPLLVSVRSGSVSSMPGMLETILNIGLNDQAVEGLAAESGNPRFAWDSYRRLISSFGTTVRNIPRARFDAALAAEKQGTGAVLDREIDAAGHRRLVEKFLEIYEAGCGEPFPQNREVQLLEAVQAVFLSWRGARAAEYRRLHGIPEDDGTAVTVQAMVFGNRGHRSGTGVAFTRNPSTGERGIYADFLLNAQGEDVVGGGADPDRGEDLLRSMPDVHQRLVEIGHALESRFSDMQDIEYTVEEGRLHLLQTRSGKRTPLAALRIALDLAREGIIDRAAALERVRDVDLSRVRQPRLEIPPGIRPIARGEVAAIGSISGRVALTCESARRMRTGDPILLLRTETRTEDLPGIIACDGIITARGGRTSHAAVVARHLGKACITGCTPLEIDEDARLARLGSYQLIEGDWISLDGRTGNIYSGRFESSLEGPEDSSIQVAREWARELGLQQLPTLGAEDQAAVPERRDHM